jgi:hypothetical protein
MMLQEIKWTSNTIRVDLKAREEDRQVTIIPKVEIVKMVTITFIIISL